MGLGLIIFVTLLLILDLLASRFGADSRDGSDWIAHQDVIGLGR